MLVPETTHPLLISFSVYTSRLSQGPSIEVILRESASNRIEIAKPKTDCRIPELQYKIQYIPHQVQQYLLRSSSVTTRLSWRQTYLLVPLGAEEQNLPDDSIEVRPVRLNERVEIAFPLLGEVEK
jgi:hypothetical protein